MKDLNSIVNKCETIMNDCGIKHGKITKVEINSRAKSFWGKTTTKDCKNYIINISSQLLQDSVKNEAAETTVLHEMLHTVPGCMDHGNKWMELANKINQRHGYNIKPKTSSEEKGIKEEYTYIVKCKECGREYGRYRMSDVIRYPFMYECHCGGNLERIK